MQGHLKDRALTKITDYSGPMKITLGLITALKTNPQSCKFCWHGKQSLQIWKRDHTEIVNNDCERFQYQIFLSLEMFFISKKSLALLLSQNLLVRLTRIS